jgi:hypothetical protein
MSGKRKKMAQNENEQAQTRQAQKKDEVPEKKEQIEYLLYIYRQKQAGQSIHLLRPVCFHIVDLIFLNRRLPIILTEAGNRSFRSPAFA